MRVAVGRTRSPGQWLFSTGRSPDIPAWFNVMGPSALDQQDMFQGLTRRGALHQVSSTQPLRSVRSQRARFDRVRSTTAPLGSSTDLALIWSRPGGRSLLAPKNERPVDLLGARSSSL